MIATILRDAYQAEGFKSRMVTCLPKDSSDNDCHVINVVWPQTFNKWLWMDPTFNAYVSDKHGNLLSVAEVREGLINGMDLVLNEDANWNNQNAVSKEYYLGYYMSKNLYWIRCHVSNFWDIETLKANSPLLEYINLYPGTFNIVKASRRNIHESRVYEISNPAYFWQNPGKE